MIAIKNGKIVAPYKIIEGKILLLNHDRICGFADSLDSVEDVERVVNAHGRYIIPGIIDVHSDKIEQFIQPRPTSQMDFEFALKVCERDLLGAGITTIYHSISLFKDEFFGKSPLRTKENVLKIADLISNIHTRNHLIHHRFHLRIEIDNMEAFDIARDMIEREMTQLISFMDHSPGQGQYSDLTVYRSAVSGYNGKEIESLGFEGVMEHHKNKPRLSFKQLGELAEMAHARNIPVASHDDDTEEKLALNKKIGVDISEFPINIETAACAKKQGFFTVVGSPNILRGCSHSGNMKAAEAILKDCADILCSDYYPAAILNSLFYMHTKHNIPLHKMVAKATLNPAKAMRIEKDYGSIEKGKKADLMIVDMLDGYPVITHVFVDGNATSRIEYRR
ncbi:MAG: alpha-D-ribose 1-methylphosphonate 5-triphosphate diphosphatase [Clostridiales bacterium]|nr:alpha-D-ribose 1-methylphosphonate 5-triphosphate diphosphatase [Clostridiales bacterium]